MVGFISIYCITKRNIAIIKHVICSFSKPISQVTQLGQKYRIKDDHQNDKTYLMSRIMHSLLSTAMTSLSIHIYPLHNINRRSLAEEIGNY
jgi:hypothetical protein